MGLFDIFSDRPARDAADAQISGLNTGYNTASGSINQGIDALKTNYGAALQPFMGLQDTANSGVTALKNALGLGGAAGTDSALTALRNTPGYKFQQQTLDDTVNAQAAASGMNASGNQLLALNKVNQGLADSTSNNYINQLQPFLSTAGQAAGGIAGVNTGLGNSLAGQYDSLANLGWQRDTGIGAANANADLAKYNASGNIWNALGSLGGMKTSGGGSVGGNAASGLGTAAMSLFSMFSDERLKEDIEPVGELFDGQKVYSYRYKGDHVPRIGLMAQEVEQLHPEAVTEIAGFKAVDYAKATRFASELSRFLEAA